MNWVGRRKLREGTRRGKIEVVVIVIFLKKLQWETHDRDEMNRVAAKGITVFVRKSKRGNGEQNEGENFLIYRREL